MKRNFFFILLIFISLGMVVSCVSRKPQEPVIITKTKEIIKTVKDTIYKVDADSSFYTAFIDCVNGKPILRETAETKAASKAGKFLKVPKTTLVGNKLNSDCEAQEQELYKKWEETYIKEHEQTPIYIDKPVEVEKPLTFWQKTQIWFGRIFMGILSLFLIVGVLRYKRLI